MSLKKNETGKVLRVAAGFDMSSNTELTLDFTLPDSTTAQKTSADGVVIGAGVTDPDLGVLTANEYVEYPIETGFLSQTGSWQVSLIYTNTTPTPDDVYIGDCATFIVTDSVC